MAKTKVFIADARISYPALEEPRLSVNGDNPRYEATFLFAPNSQAAQQLKQAVETVAEEPRGLCRESVHHRKIENAPGSS